MPPQLRIKPWPSTQAGNEADCLINEPGGVKSPSETTTSDDISCPVM